MNRIIINADDYGLNKSNTSAIADAFGKNFITDTTILANGKCFDEAVTLAKEHGFFDKIGVHLNLTEGKPMTDDIKKCKSFVEDGLYHHRNNRLKPLSKFEKDAIYKELTAQIEKIQSVGIKITHADSHHHIHTAVFIAPIVAAVCHEQGIAKIRLHRNIGTISGFKMFVKKKYNNWLHRQGFTTAAYFGSLIDIENVEIADNTEIMVHPDFDKNGILVDRIGEEDGFPVGKKLPNLQTERKVILRGYAEL